MECRDEDLPRQNVNRPVLALCHGSHGHGATGPVRLHTGARERQLCADADLSLDRAADLEGINMRLFIAVFFWISLVSAVLRLLIIANRTYPHQKTDTLGSDLASFIEGAIFVVWAGVLLWGAR